ncbi:MAG: hypothetical protein IRY83_16870 [Chloroflexi bacterium]|nr:hypothetical protein [Chloroflexota bacterium]
MKQRDFDQFARDSETMLRFASKCGMTPASRARLGIVWTDRGWRRRRAPYQKLTGRETPPERREENEEAESDDDA